MGMKCARNHPTRKSSAGRILKSREQRSCTEPGKRCQPARFERACSARDPRLVRATRRLPRLGVLARAAGHGRKVVDQSAVLARLSRAAVLGVFALVSPRPHAARPGADELAGYSPLAARL